MLYDALTRRQLGRETVHNKLKGCTSDMVFTRRSCDNKCYDEKKTFGGIEHYMCLHCCTGDIISGIISTFASTTLALVKYIYF